MILDDPFIKAGFSEQEAQELWRVYNKFSIATPHFSAQDFAHMLLRLICQPVHKIELSELLEPEEIELLKRYL